MNSRYLPAWMVCLPILLAGCEKPHEVKAADYDVACTKDAECKTVVVGNPCECSCNEAAINDRDVEDYTSDINELRGACVEKAAKCKACPEPNAAICKASKCQVAEGKISR